MRQTILKLAAIVGLAVAGTVPAMACGFDSCNTPAYSYSYPVYAPPAPVVYPSSGCNSCGGSYARLAEPTTQYYYANQGPTYSGPGAFAPYPTYREAAVPVYQERPSYSYGYGASRYANTTPYYEGAGAPAYGYHRLHRSYYARPSYYAPRQAYYARPSYGYRHHSVARMGYAPYYQGHRVLRRYY